MSQNLIAFAPNEGLDAGFGRSPDKLLQDFGFHARDQHEASRIVANDRNAEQHDAAGAGLAGRVVQRLDGELARFGGSPGTGAESGIPAAGAAAPGTTAASVSPTAWPHAAQNRASADCFMRAARAAFVAKAFRVEQSREKKWAA